MNDDSNLERTTKAAVDGYNPVSYTHLDVYKRQARHTADPTGTSRRGSRRTSIAPCEAFVVFSHEHTARTGQQHPAAEHVSYTHLDVYKRQGYTFGFSMYRW